MDLFFDHFKEQKAGQTKHEWMVDGILSAIKGEKLENGQTLPSVNEFMVRLSLSRMTVVKALNDLKDRGILEARNRVGYFLKNSNIEQQLKVMLVLTAFSPYHEDLYHALLQGLEGRQITVDLFFHHGNPVLLSAILKEHSGKYGVYIVTPIEDREVLTLMEGIPAQKLVQIVRPACSRRKISYVSQDFYEEVIGALNSISEEICAYEKFNLVFPEKNFHSLDIVRAFTSFCVSKGIPHAVVDRVHLGKLKAKQAWFVIEDGHLVELIKYADSEGLQLGRDLGILSYNDTPMKEIVRQGITVISTDFQEMGRKVARFILEREAVRAVIPTKIIKRNSL